MNNYFFAGIIASAFFALSESAAAQPEYCQQAIPDAYLSIDDMIGEAAGVYLLQAVDSSSPTEEIQDSNGHTQTPPKENNTLTEPPALPDFKTEITSTLEGRENPDRLTVTPQVPFINTQSFIVLETLAGPTEQRISLKSSSRTTSNHAALASDFDNHTSLEFWQQVEVGRTPLNTQCQIEMSFEAGQTYLVFTGLKHPKAFEHIRTLDDKWLNFIRISTQMEQKP